jgi:DNA helicase MCM8
VDFALLVSHLKPVVGDQEADNLNGALEANPELVLSCIGVAVHIATLADAGPIAATQDHRVCPRLRNFSPITPMRSLKANSVGHFVAIRGTVIRVSNIKPVVVRMPFICSKCHQKCLARFSDGKYAPPVKCESVKCRSKTFIPLRDEAETMDWQRVRYGCSSSSPFLLPDFLA